MDILSDDDDDKIVSTVEKSLISVTHEIDNDQNQRLDSSSNGLFNAPWRIPASVTQPNLTNPITNSQPLRPPNNGKINKDGGISSQPNNIIISPDSNPNPNLFDNTYQASASLPIHSNLTAQNNIGKIPKSVSHLEASLPARITNINLISSNSHPESESQQNLEFQSIEECINFRKSQIKDEEIRLCCCNKKEKIQILMDTIKSYKKKSIQISNFWKIRLNCPKCSHPISQKDLYSIFGGILSNFYELIYSIHCCGCFEELQEETHYSELSCGHKICNNCQYSIEKYKRIQRMGKIKNMYFCYFCKEWENLENICFKNCEKCIHSSKEIDRIIKSKKNKCEKCGKDFNEEDIGFLRNNN